MSEYNIDYSSQHGASILAIRIIEYWKARGVKPKCRIVPIGRDGSDDPLKTGNTALYGIRSDLGMYEPR